MLADLVRMASGILAYIPLAIGDGIQGYVGVFFGAAPLRHLGASPLDGHGRQSGSPLAIDHTRTRLAECGWPLQQELLLRVSQAARRTASSWPLCSPRLPRRVAASPLESCVIELT